MDIYFSGLISKNIIINEFTNINNDHNTNIINVFDCFKHKMIIDSKKNCIIFLKLI